ncbi:hypothetical protein H2199_000747 [Coniosporium tulheliwenetii]|uniref:Uncharacterized protein n=1 Tax=Coniosporium tulheliwenetii TaxID=3383036 RepID=A0ACC2ZMQ0_9PEZI|nr:hypothetical protein H2199_000747 [Cladosporium sp. JES 115]
MPLDVGTTQTSPPLRRTIAGVGPGDAGIQSRELARTAAPDRAASIGTRSTGIVVSPRQAWPPQRSQAWLNEPEAEANPTTAGTNAHAAEAAFALACLSQLLVLVNTAVIPSTSIQPRATTGGAVVEDEGAHPGPRAAQDIGAAIVRAEAAVAAVVRVALDESLRQPRSLALQV